MVWVVSNSAVNTGANVSDILGNTYHHVVSEASATGSLDLWVATSIKAGVNTVTATGSGVTGGAFTINEIGAPAAAYTGWLSPIGNGLTVGLGEGFFVQAVGVEPTITETATFSGGVSGPVVPYNSFLATFYSDGTGLPTIRELGVGSAGGVMTVAITQAGETGVTGDSILVVFQYWFSVSYNAATPVITDAFGNTYQLLHYINDVTYGTQGVWLAQNIVGGPDIDITGTSTSNMLGDFHAYTVSRLTALPVGTSTAIFTAPVGITGSDTITLLPSAADNVAMTIYEVQSLVPILYNVGSNPAEGQYSVDNTGDYTFNLADIGRDIFISYKYSVPPGVGGFGLIAAYTTEGDSGLTPTVSLTSLPVPPLAPGEPLSLVWNTLNVAFIGITGNNGVDYQPDGFNTGLLSATGSSLYAVGNGFTANIALTLQAYDATQTVIPGLISRFLIIIT